MSKKLIALALAGVFAFTFSVKAVTVEELQAQIQSLLAQIAQLQQQLAAAQGGTTTTGLCLSTDLKYGMRGDAVKTLQEGLKQDPSVYPEGLVTGYFGPLTKAAVIRFQEKYASEILAPWGL
ncbi:peptidoglycan-binding protein, partial [bacterium]|nr:peptidoglycan-binding protein [bacterium]